MKSLVGFLVLTICSAVQAAEPDGARPYLVLFTEAPLATYDGTVAGLQATSPRLRGVVKLHLASRASQRYLAYLDERRTEHLRALGDRIGRPLGPIHVYRAAAHGVSLRLAPHEVEIVAAYRGTLHVIEDYALELATDAGPPWIGAPGVWDGSATGGLGATAGEGVVLGFIDSGINMDHPSFTDPGGDGYDHDNPLGAGVFTGWCDPANIPPGGNPGPFVCNDKLIGAWDFIDPYCMANPDVCSEADGPEDDHSHGTHTASIAAGNVVPTYAISGVAPHANLIAYDACFTVNVFFGSCPLSALAASVDQAILDGVDVLSFSIVGGWSPWSPDDIDSFFLSAVEAGVVVSAAAGNDGPSAESVMHRGPWVLTTGASTHHRVAVANQLVDLSGGTNPPSDLAGQSRTGGYGPAPIVSAGDFPVIPDAARCGDWTVPFPAGTWTAGEIVVCDNGDIPQVIKCFNVMQGGAGGCVIANVFDDIETLADPHVLPAIHLSRPESDSLRSWLSSGSGHTATITAAEPVFDDGAADVIAEFSSRGPNPAFDVIKPDLVAPGVEIFAAARDDFVGFWFNQPEVPNLVVNEFAAMRGTSMSTPHTSGAAALMRGLHPTLTPAEIKSLLMTTAATAGVGKRKGVDSADTFDMGAGRVELRHAARAGFVLDETGQEFRAADPGLGGDPRALNLPSMMSRACGDFCRWMRTMRSLRSETVAWTVSTDGPGDVEIQVYPDPIVLGPGGAATIEIRALATAATPQDEWRLATITFTPDDPTIPAAHMPVMVRFHEDIFSDGFESGDLSAWSGP